MSDHRCGTSERMVLAPVIFAQRGGDDFGPDQGVMGNDEGRGGGGGEELQELGGSRIINAVVVLTTVMMLWVRGPKNPLELAVSRVPSSIAIL